MEVRGFFLIHRGQAADLKNGGLRYLAHNDRPPGLGKGNPLVGGAQGAVGACGPLENLWHVAKGGR